jgi:hypothetical protein
MSKLQKFLYILNLAVPFVLPLFKVPPIAVGLIGHAISTAEMMGGTGESKKASAMQIISDGIGTTNAIANKTIIDPSILPTISLAIDSTIKTIKVLSSTTPQE